MRQLMTRLGSIFAVSLALISPFLTLLLFKGKAYQVDVDYFLNWSRCLTAAVDSVYSACSPFAINYPTIGLWASAGAILAIESIGGAFPPPTTHFQYYLGGIDALNIVLMYLLLRGLRVRGAAWLTLLFAVLPSTRAGASLWGQIDNVGQLFLSLGFLCGLQGLKAAERSASGRTLLYLITLALCIGFATLTKQLLYFSIPSLAILWCTLAIRASRILSPAPILLSWLFAFATTLAIDQLSPTPPGFFGSSLYYVLTTGSDHAGLISLAGVNLYPLLHLPLMESSTVAYTVVRIGTLSVKIIPFYFGLTSFFVACGLSAWWLARIARKGQGASPIQVTVTLLALAAICNLFMNTFLSGTHERYLYHYGFFVFPVVCVFTQQRFMSPFMALLCLAHLTIYGCFVYSLIIGEQDFRWAVNARRCVAGMNIAISVYALWLLRRISSRRLTSMNEG